MGKTIRLAPPDALRAQLPPPPAGVPQAPDRIIVGIVADLENGNADHAAEPEAFAPITQYAGEGWGPGNFVVRTDNDPMALVPSVQKLIASLDPHLVRPWSNLPWELSAGEPLSSRQPLPLGS